MSVILACDVGTSSLKLAAFGADGRMRAAAQRPYPTTTPRPGWTEQDPGDWLRALAGAVAELAAAGHVAEAEAIAFTGQMSAVVLMAADGSAVRPAMIWSDTRATAEAAAIETETGRETYFDLVGSPPAATYPSAKALWLARHEPENLRRVQALLQPKDFIIARLTGVAAVDPSDASCTGFMDIARDRWDERLMALAGVAPGLLPDIRPSASVVGRVTAPAAWSGLPEGLPVVLGGGDGPVTALGVGASVAGRIYACLGTSAWISEIAERPSSDPGRRLISYRHVLPGLYAVTGSTQNCGNVLDWLARRVAGTAAWRDTLAADLDSVPPGAEGLLFVPYLHGERAPLWDPAIRGALLGIDPSHGPAHFVRATIEGIGFELRQILDVFRAAGGARPPLAIVGGISESAPVRRLLAEILGMPVAPVAEGAATTVRGAAMLGALALGIATPEDTGRWVELGRDVEPPGEMDPRLARARRGFDAAYAALSSVRTAMNG